MALIPVMPTSRLRNGLEICKIVNGMWQVSGAHGDIDPSRAVLSMNEYAEMGFTTFDMADIYGPAEDIFGSFLKLRPDAASDPVQGLTKMVPRPGSLSKESVVALVGKSMERMGVSKLDCLQFHWWDLGDKRYLDVLATLTELQHAGKITELSLTNFDTKATKEIVESGYLISTNQVQYSVIDIRPQKEMTKFCLKNSIKLLTYGTLCGGMLTEKYLGLSEPKPAELSTASLGKYKHVIDQWGGWVLFQEMLQVLHQISEQHNVSIANVATRYILDDPVVAGVIVGCRFGMKNCDHSKDNFRSISSSWHLTEENLAAIKTVQSKSKDLFKIIGDCGGEYR